MTTRPTRTSRIRRTVVVATLAAAMLVPTAAQAAPKDAPNQGKKATAEQPITTQGLSWLGLSWL